MEDFTTFVQKQRPIIDEFLRENLTIEIEDANMAEMLSYSVMAGGKRLRPLLFLATLDALNFPISEKELKIASGIELIHTYSLIHDDLPAMDNDDYRRGKLTSHKKFGEAYAILAGDALQSMGIEWVASANNSELVSIITQAIGPNGMVLGQDYDMRLTNNHKQAHNKKIIDKMEWLKTGCLILASVQMAAVYAAANDEYMQKLGQFAHAFGRAYQIYDDLIDVLDTLNHAGKATHKDEAEGKNNSLTLNGIKKSQQELKELIVQANNALKGINSGALSGFLDVYQRVL